MADRWRWSEHSPRRYLLVNVASQEIHLWDLEERTVVQKCAKPTVGEPKRNCPSPAFVIASHACKGVRRIAADALDVVIADISSACSAHAGTRAKSRVALSFAHRLEAPTRPS